MHPALGKTPALLPGLFFPNAPHQTSDDPPTSACSVVSYCSVQSPDEGLLNSTARRRMVSADSSWRTTQYRL